MPVVSITLSEYISGFKPSQYKLSTLVKFTMENLQEKKIQHKNQWWLFQAATLPVGRVWLHISYAKIEPLDMARRVQVWSQVKFVEVSGDFDSFGQISRLETWFEDQRVGWRQKPIVLSRRQTIGCARSGELEKNRNVYRLFCGENEILHKVPNFPVGSSRSIHRHCLKSCRPKEPVPVPFLMPGSKTPVRVDRRWYVVGKTQASENKFLVLLKLA